MIISRISALVFVMTLSFSSVSAEVYKFLNYELGEQYQAVAPRVDVTDPYNCDEWDDPSDYLTPGWKLDLLNEINQIPLLPDLKNKKIVSIFQNIFSKDCKLQSRQVLNFCRSNGVLIHQGFLVPLTKNGMEYFEIFEEDSPVFMGVGRDYELLDSNYAGPYFSHFTSYSDKHNALKNTRLLFDRHQDPETKIPSYLVHHNFYKMPRDAVYKNQFQLCPDGEDRISDLKFKFHSLDKVFFTASFLIGAYEGIRKSHNICTAFFPEQEELFDRFYIKYRKLNEKNFQSIRSKVERILVFNDDPELETIYDKKLSVMMNVSTLDLNMNSDEERAYSLKQCLRWFDRDPTVIGSNRSKNRYDLDYIKSIKLP